MLIQPLHSSNSYLDSNTNKPNFYFFALGCHVLKMGRIVHYAVDLTLFAGFLSGIKKNTGITPDLSLIGQPDVEYYASKYFDYGDLVYDNTVSFMKTSKYFVKNLF